MPAIRGPTRFMPTSAASARCTSRQAETRRSPMTPACSYEHAAKAGVDARLDIVPDMLHTFQMAAGRAPEADDAIRELAGWVRPRLGL